MCTPRRPSLIVSCAHMSACAQSDASGVSIRGGSKADAGIGANDSKNEVAIDTTAFDNAFERLKKQHTDALAKLASAESVGGPTTTAAQVKPSLDEDPSESTTQQASHAAATAMRAVDEEARLKAEEQERARQAERQRRMEAAEKERQMKVRFLLVHSAHSLARLSYHEFPDPCPSTVRHTRRHLSRGFPERRLRNKIIAHT